MKCINGSSSQEVVDSFKTMKKLKAMGFNAIYGTIDGDISIYNVHNTFYCNIDWQSLFNKSYCNYRY